jgi:recombination protein RecT
MGKEIQKSKLSTIKETLLSKGSIALFGDNLPNATGKHAIEAAQRFAKMAYTAICQNPTLQQCSLPSLVKAASMSASLDLDIDTRGLAYLVPYKNKGVMEAQFQIGYLGLIELAYRSGKVKAISAHCIYESEKGKVKIERINGQYVVEHPFSYESPTGKVVAAYACAEIEGMGAQTAVLRIDEVEKLRQKSKAPNSPAWTQFYEAMCKKTVIRQLAKFLPKSIMEEFSKGASMDEQESFIEAKVTAQDTINSQVGTEEVDAFFEAAEPEVDEEPDFLKDVE